MPATPAALVPQVADTPRSALDRLRHLEGIGSIALVDDPQMDQAQVVGDALGGRLKMLTERITALESHISEEFVRNVNGLPTDLSNTLDLMSQYRAELASLANDMATPPKA